MLNKLISNYNLKRLIDKLKEDDIFALASQLAYSLLLSFFPFLIFLMTIMGFSSISSNDVLLNLKGILPKSAYTLIYDTVLEIFNTQNKDLLSFSLIVTIWVASNGFYAVIKGLNKAYDDNEERPLWKVRLTAILCTFILIFIIIFCLFLLVLGNLIGYTLTKRLNLPFTFNTLWLVLRYIITVVSLIFIFSFIYRFTPSRKLSFKDVLLGSVFATAGWIMASMGFAFYVDNFGNYSKTYGSIGAVIVLLLWLFISSLILLIGGEINGLVSTKYKHTYR